MDWAKRAKAGALTVLLLAVGCQRDARERFAVVPAKPAPALEAPRASGSVFRLSEQRGKVVLLSFGYTACPDVCPTTLSQLRQLEERLGDAARNMEVVFLSVDPERDSAQRLEEYVRAFHPRFTGLRLERPALEAVLSAFQVTAVRRYPDAARYSERPFAGGSPYTVDHTGAYLVIDAHGTLRLRLPYTATLEQMQAAIAPLLAEVAETPSVQVEQAQARLTPAKVGAVYFTVVNAAARDDRLLSAESPAARQVELHEVVPEGEVLRMVPRPEGFVVPARGRVELRPGGKHLMLYAVQGPASSIELTLRFERAGELRLSIPVTPLEASAH